MALSEAHHVTLACPGTRHNPVEPEQGEVINGPNLGDLSRRRAGPSAGNRSAAKKPLEHEPEFVLSETFDLFRAT